MTRTDRQRWNDWRGNAGSPIKHWKRCRCGERFEPVIVGQALCPRCVGHELEGEAQELRQDREAQRLKNETELAASIRADAQRAAAERAVQFARPHRSKEERASRSKGRNCDRPPLRGAKGVGREGGRSTSAAWAHVARRRAKEGMSPRKIAKMLGVSLDAVVGVLNDPSPSSAPPRRP